MVARAGEDAPDEATLTGATGPYFTILRAN